jgi:hypothetical protein
MTKEIDKSERQDENDNEGIWIRNGLIMNSKCDNESPLYPCLHSGFLAMLLAVKRHTLLH